jgi:16S rRNA (uracil1498-N3)-methyltransferase
MRTIRSHVDAVLAPGAIVALPEGQSLRLLRVLRLGVGDPCVLFNGDGNDYPAVLRSTARRIAEFEVLSLQPVHNESPLRLELVQGIARGEKMDLILQKATELGVVAIHPVFTERTEVRLDAERMDKRVQHWRGVIEAACEQSGRARLPALTAPRSLAEHLAADGGEALRLVLDPHQGVRVSELTVAPALSVVLLVGPEGGLGERDLMATRQAGFRGMRLGPRILRTETAGLAALAALQTRFGDMG